jgi:hypothetical protein
MQPMTYAQRHLRKDLYPSGAEPKRPGDAGGCLAVIIAIVIVIVIAISLLH